MAQIFFQANPLNKFTITNQKGKYGTSLREEERKCGEK